MRSALFTISPEAQVSKILKSIWESEGLNGINGLKFLEKFPQLENKKQKGQFKQWFFKKIVGAYKRTRFFSNGKAPDYDNLLSVACAVKSAVSTVASTRESYIARYTTELVTPGTSDEKLSEATRLYTFGAFNEATDQMQQHVVAEYADYTPKFLFPNQDQSQFKAFCQALNQKIEQELRDMGYLKQTALESEQATPPLTFSQQDIDNKRRASMPPPLDLHPRGKRRKVDPDSDSERSYSFDSK